MKTIMVMFDSLNRRMLSPYGCDWVHTPNFARLAKHCVTFDRAYVGSMPCMPARREIHTGRYNFLHRSWGPLEPFDDSMPEILKKNGIHSHLASDHYHYWEEGGCNYHTRYSTWDFSRGQEGDPWKANLTNEIPIPETRNDREKSWLRQDFVNRHYMQKIEDQPQPMTFANGLEFIETNHAEDNWFLHIETFDPHEPYFSDKKYKDLYPHKYDGPHFDWPPYARVTEDPETIEHLRCESAALHTMCDEHLGRVLDMMDKHDLWKDTMLIVNTDHGFLMSEHDWWAKCCQPYYNEIANTPLFIWDPRCGCRDEHRQSLVQTIDLAPTVLEFFGLERPNDMLGKPLCDTVASDTPVREAALYGMHGAHVNCTDGRYVYMRGSVQSNKPLSEYTLMPTHMKQAFQPDELQDIELREPFRFTKGCRTMKIEGRSWLNSSVFGTMLFDLESDPLQQSPLQDAEAEEKMIKHLANLLKENDAPAEQFQRLGIESFL